jgi:fatty acid desaturase
MNERKTPAHNTAFCTSVAGGSPMSCNSLLGFVRRGGGQKFFIPIAIGIVFVLFIFLHIFNQHLVWAGRYPKTSGLIPRIHKTY